MLNEFHRKLADIVAINNYPAAFADPGREIALIDNYSYSVDQNGITPITSAAAQTFNVIMDTDSTFLMTSIAGAARITGQTAPTYNPALMIQITDKSSGRNYFNQSQLMALIAGAGGFGFTTTSPRIVRPRSTLAVNVFAAQPAASFDGFYMTFSGARIFYK